MAFTSIAEATVHSAVGEMDVARLPVWTAWVFTDAPNVDDILTGRPIKVGGAMTTQKAWEAAKREMDARPDAIAMAVRRDGELF